MNKTRELFLDLYHNAPIADSGIHLHDLSGIEFFSEFGKPMRVMETMVIGRDGKAILQVKVEYDVYANTKD